MKLLDVVAKAGQTLLLVVAMPALAYAGEESGGKASEAHGREGTKTTEAAHGGHEEASGAGAHSEKHGDAHHAVHSHHVALFGGAVTTDEATHPSIGADYEYRLPVAQRMLGVGVFVEAVFAEHVELVGGAGVLVHAVGGLKLLLGGGVELAEEETAVLFRAGAGYDLHLGPVSLTPTVAVDYVHEHVALVYGLGVGMGF